jgi:hypothetical protein
MSKKSEIAKTKQRDSKGHFVKYQATAAYQESQNGLRGSYGPSPLNNGLNYRTAANSSFIALPEIVPPMLPNPAVTPMAPGVYHVNTYRSIASTPGGIYRNLDEALRACPQTAKAMLQDISVVGPLYQRWMSLISYNESLVPADENDEVGMDFCEKIMEEIESIPRWSEFKRNLMWAAWYGKHLNVIDWEFKYGKDGRKLKVKNWIPIIGDKLIFRNNGRMGYLCHRFTGYRDVVYSDHGQAELFMPEDQDCLVHHKYFVTDSTWDESMLAIGIEGFGYRHILYWTYWLKMQLLEWAMNAFQIFGAGGIRIGYFEQGNPASEQAVSAAMSQANGQNIILFPRPIGEEGQGAGLEVIAPQGLDLSHFQHFIEDYFNNQIQKLILGWDFEKGAIRNTARDDYYRLQCYDATTLGETITRDLVNVIIKYNYPEAAEHGIKYQISVPVNEPDIYLQSIQRAWELGLPLNSSEIYAALGFTMPNKRKKQLKKPDELMTAPGHEAIDPTIRGPKKNTDSLANNLS